MNYFAHGLRFLDRPTFLVGTALPDLMSVVDRSVRFRTRALLPLADAADPFRRDLITGILQHLADDQWFHGTPAFFQSTAELSREFRELLTPLDHYRPSFLGHVAMELLLDDHLMRRAPLALEQYYAAFASVDAAAIESLVSELAGRPVARIAEFVSLFSRERFLSDYADDDRLRYRLNQVLRRVKLEPLPPEASHTLARARSLVEPYLRDLLAGWTDDDWKQHVSQPESPLEPNHPGASL